MSLYKLQRPVEVREVQRISVKSRDYKYLEELEMEDLGDFSKFQPLHDEFTRYNEYIVKFPDGEIKIYDEKKFKELFRPIR